MSTTPEEVQYLELIRDILANGTLESGRNGNTLSVFGRTMRFSLADGRLPILTTKQMAWKTCAKELFWFLSGSTDNAVLQKQGVRIWDGNASREFLDSRGLTEYAENELGPVYGHQWRRFGAPYTPLSQQTTPEFSTKKEAGIDQIQQIIDTLRDPAQRSSRRILLSAWNPLQLDEMALPPCHVLAQFHVREGKYLSCALFQRSCDVGLGFPFNILSYSLLTHLLAKHTGLVADEFVYFMGNAHIYEEHRESLEIQCQRVPFEFPHIDIASDPKPSIEDYTLEDIRFQTPYRHHSPIVMHMKA